MKYLGIDFGAKRVGIAVSDPHGSIAFPRGVLSNDAGMMDALLSFVTNERIDRIVIGDGKSHGGLDNPITVDIETFADALRDASSIPVELVSEAWSSIEANRYAPDDHAHDDSAAAAVVLQRYLDIQNGSVD